MVLENEINSSAICPRRNSASRGTYMSIFVYVGCMYGAPMQGGNGRRELGPGCWAVHPTTTVMAWKAVEIIVLTALPLQLSSFVLVPALLPGLNAHQHGQRASAPPFPGAAGERVCVFGSVATRGVPGLGPCTIAHCGLLAGGRATLYECIFRLLQSSVPKGMLSVFKMTHVDVLFAAAGAHSSR